MADGVCFSFNISETKQCCSPVTTSLVHLSLNPRPALSSIVLIFKSSINYKLRAHDVVSERFHSELFQKAPDLFT